MARTLVQIKKQIEKLEKEADRVRALEVAGVVQRIKSAIDFYGLTAGDLFGVGTAAKGKGRRGAPGRKASKAKKASAPAKYIDKPSGRTWTGHGKRPGWFVEAVAKGVKPEEMAV